MKLLLSVKYILILSGLMIILTGCASFSKNQLPVADLEKLPEGTQKPTVSYSFTSGVDFFDKKEHFENARKMLEQEFAEVLIESGYFVSVSAGGEADINMQVRLVNSGNPAAVIPAFITGLSLYIIPSWGTDRYNISAKISTRDRKYFNYELSDSMVTVQWLPLVVMLPFKNPINVSKETRRNL